MGKANIFYFTLTDEQTKDEKLHWFSEAKLKDIPFDHIRPDKNNNWINLSDNDFESLLPLASKDVKSGKGKKALFELFSLGVVTNRDEWVYDFNKKDLTKKVKLFCDIYESEMIRWNNSNKKTAINNFVDRTIKWTEELEAHLMKGNELKFNDERVLESIYRPFVKQYFYFDRIITHRLYQNENIFGLINKHDNLCIGFIGKDTQKPFSVLAHDKLVGLNFLSPASGCQSFPLYSYDDSGNRIENITDWGYNQFVKQYGKKGMSKEAIFNYVYAALHNPAYRKKYELNLKREFPRIPFYKDFKKWSEWGKALMDLHINYEKTKPHNLTEHDATEKPKGRNEEFRVLEPEASYLTAIKVKLKADKENGVIILDDATSLSGIPKEAWNYKLGNRSALEWVLDQYKEKKPGDPTIAEKFNTYRFADYKDHVIDLLKRVCTVSIETMKIVSEMETESVK